MTLIELSIYASLLMMLMLAIYGTFAASIKYFTVAQAQTDLQNAAQTSIMHIITDISESTSADLSTDTVPAGVIFVSARSNDGGFQSDSNGNILWQKWVCYYFDATSGTIVRQTKSFTPSTTPPPSTLHTTDFKNLAGGRVVARNVTAFNITGTTVVTVAATFQTTVASNAAHTADTQVQIRDQFKLRN